MSSKLNHDELKDWVDKFSETNQGKIKLINLFQAQLCKFAEQKVIQRFISDCISLGTTLGTTTAYDVLVHYDVVCKRNDAYFAMCKEDHLALDTASILVTTMDSTTFHEHILKRPKTVIKTTILDKPKSIDPADESAYRAKLLKAISGPGWARATATLGTPFPDPRHVWFTDLSYLEAELLSVTTVDTDATKVRDALGLIETNANEPLTTTNAYLLAIKFPSTMLHSIRDLKMARPGFADLGNRRYALYINREAESVYQNNWGVTVNLKKMREVPKQAINGLPERICSPIALSGVETQVEVEPMGWVVGNRGDEVGVDDDEAFVKRLLNRRKIEDVKTQIIKRNARKS